MASKKKYAWTIFHSVDKDGKRFTINPGDEVTAAKLNVSDEQFDAYIESGSVRSAEYPVPEGSTKSPVQHYQDQAYRLSRGIPLVEDGGPTDVDITDVETGNDTRTTNAS